MPSAHSPKLSPGGGAGRATRPSQAGAASGTLPALGQACVGEYLFFGFLDVLTGISIAIFTAVFTAATARVRLK